MIGVEPRRVGQNKLPGTVRPNAPLPNAVSRAGHNIAANHSVINRGRRIDVQCPPSERVRRVVKIDVIGRVVRQSAAANKRVWLADAIGLNRNRNYFPSDRPNRSRRRGGAASSGVVACGCWRQTNGSRVQNQHSALIRHGIKPQPGKARLTGKAVLFVCNVPNTDRLKVQARAHALEIGVVRFGGSCTNKRLRHDDVRTSLRLPVDQPSRVNRRRKRLVAVDLDDVGSKATHPQNLNAEPAAVFSREVLQHHVLSQSAVAGNV